MAAVLHREIARTIAAVRASGANATVTLAFEFLVLTAARSGEVRGGEMGRARWDEMDTMNHVWTVPAARIKAKREHQVPLSGRLVQILEARRSATAPARSCSSCWPKAILPNRGAPDWTSVRPSAVRRVPNASHGPAVICSASLGTMPVSRCRCNA
ncbi:MAG: tyrosine-type recombinase/integrase [Gammaproteobacteria bacterium]|nr:tyrosine-type recombinase/integrase [Gammaproteobacteria bacterium]